MILHCHTCGDLLRCPTCNGINGQLPPWDNPDMTDDDIAQANAWSKEDDEAIEDEGEST